MNPHQVTRDFERAVAEYCGSPYAVAVNSCTNALFLCLMWFKAQGQLPTHITIPNRTYVSVPMQIVHAGSKPTFKTDLEWSGMYQLDPLPVWDCARRFTSSMWKPGQFMCTSHHWSKTLGVQQAGMILHSSPEADAWLRRARFDGRNEGVPPARDDFEELGWHMYLSPEIAAQGLMRLSVLPRHNADLPNSDYPDLSSLRCFSLMQKPANRAIAAE